MIKSRDVIYESLLNQVHGVYETVSRKVILIESIHNTIESLLF